MRLISILALLATLHAAPSQAGDAASAALVQGFGTALNAYRADAGLGSVRADPRLTAAAQRHAEDMARTGTFSHHGPDGSTMGARARAAGCDGGYMAENIAWGQDTATDAFRGWAASAGHNANMLGRPYGAFGLGAANGYWVLMFADGC